MAVLGAENTRNQETLRTLASETTVPTANPPTPQAVVAETNVVKRLVINDQPPQIQYLGSTIPRRHPPTYDHEPFHPKLINAQSLAL